MRHTPLVLVVAILAALATGYWFWSKASAPPVAPPADAAAAGLAPASGEASVATGGTVATPGGTAAAGDPGTVSRTAAPEVAASGSAAQLQGRLVDSAGAPRAGVEVRLDTWQDFGIDVALATRVDGLPLQNTRTAADGTFAFPLAVGQRGLLTLGADELVFAKGPPRIGPKAEDRQLGDLVVATAGAIEGVVLDERGDPVAGVKVSTRQEPEFGTSRGVTSDAQGRFRLAKLFPGEWTVRTAAPQYLPATAEVTLRLEEVRTGLELRLARGAAIAGRVVDDLGRGVAGAKVTALRNEERGGMRIERFTGDEAVVTDAGGNFTLAGLAGETATIRAFGRGHTEAMAANVPIGAGEVVLQVQRHGVVAGVLVGEDGAPIAGSMVHARPGTGGAAGLIDFEAGVGVPLMPGRANARTAADGTFRIEGVPPGPLTIVAEGKGHRPASQSGVVLAPAQELGGLRLIAPTGASVEIVVVDAAGQPVAGAEVKAQSPQAQAGPGMRFRATSVSAEDGDVHVIGGNDDLGSGTTDASGKVVLKALPARRLEFRASHPAHADAVPVQLEVPTAGRIDGRLQLRQPGFATVTVLGGDGAPAGGAQFSVEGPLGAPDTDTRQYTTGADGKVRVGPLAAGDYRAVLLRDQEMQRAGGMVFVTGERSELKSSERTFRIAAGETSVLDLRKPTLVTLQGRVLGAEGPVANCTVTLAEADAPEGPAIAGFGGRSATTDGDGRYRFADVVPGRMVLRYGPRDSVVKAKLEVDVFGDRTEQEQDLPLRTGTLKVQAVVAGTGEPLDGALVELQAFDPAAGGTRTSQRMMMVSIGTTGDEDGAEASTITMGENRVRTGADGIATLENVPVGTYTVLVTHPKHVKGQVADQHVHERQVTDAGRVELRPAGSIRATVLGADGKPVAFAMVECTAAEGEYRDQQPAMRGNCRFAELAPGRYRVRARTMPLGGGSQGDWGEPTEVEVKTGEAATVTLTSQAK